MNKNEAKRTLLRLFVSVFFWLIVAFSLQSRADNAFVVEEEAVIGGEGAPAVTEPVQRPEVLPPVSEKKPEALKKSKTGKKIVKEPESSEESNPVSVSENVVSENAVSQNSVSLPFRTPVRKRETKPEEKDTDKKKEIKSRKQTTAEKEKQEERPQPPVTWWLLGVGALFFLCGCTRVAKRAGKRKKNIIV